MKAASLSKVKGRITRSFFDSEKVLAATTRAERRNLSRFGAYVRQTAKRSIRKRKRAAAPGSPPSSHSGALRKRIFFQFDLNRRSVIVGPERISSKLGDAPHALEEGGTSVIGSGPGKGRSISIASRPFMRPAFEAELPNAPKLWADSVR